MDLQRSEAFGGPNGRHFSDDVGAGMRLRRIVVRAGYFVDSIQPEWESDEGHEVAGVRHGGEGGVEHVVELREDEVITRISGRADGYLDQITFHTNKRRSYGPFGGDGGTAFELKGLRVVGFHGAAHDFVDRLGFLSEPKPSRRRNSEDAEPAPDKAAAMKPARPRAKAEMQLTADEPTPRGGDKPKRKPIKDTLGTGTAKRRAV